MAQILLTGANGQLGWEVFRRVSATGHSLAATARDQLDISDRASVQTVVHRLRPKVILNAAAYTAVDKAESDRDAAFAINAEGPGHLAEAAAEVGAAIIHISTDYVFDGSAPGAYAEDHPTAPLGAYGESKRAGEEAVAARTLRHAILRTAWVYGVHGHNFVKTMLRVGAERDELRVVDDQRGCPTFAGDLAEACLALSGRYLAGEEGYGVFHCAGSGETTWCGLARETFALAAPRTGRSPVVHAITTADYPTPARRPANSVLDCSRLAAVHGIRMRDWRPALADMLEETLAAAG
ncbi:MAG: dTDP-4-dehydrorhamnose reductase [Pseudomonadota bacterium]